MLSTVEILRASGKVFFFKYGGTYPQRYRTNRNAHPIVPLRLNRPPPKVPHGAFCIFRTGVAEQIEKMCRRCNTACLAVVHSECCATTINLQLAGRVFHCDSLRICVLLFVMVLFEISTIESFRVPRFCSGHSTIKLVAFETEYTGGSLHEACSAGKPSGCKNGTPLHATPDEGLNELPGSR